MKKSKKPIKEVSKGKTPIPTGLRLQSKTFFLTYKGTSNLGEKLTKENLANFLVNQNINDRKLRPEKYLICEEMYDSGEPHFHAILVYPTRKQIITQDYYDYLGIHPNIQTMRNMKAALDYVYKEDPHPYTNMDIAQQKRVARAKDTSSLYQFLEEQMKKDPFNFDVYSYCLKYNISKQIYKANYTKAVTLVKKIQQAYCNSLLTQKPGFKFINRPLIESQLSVSQLSLYDSWPGYQTIVNHLNIMITHKGKRQMKTLNLLITGPPSIGKTSLFSNPNHKPDKTCVQDFCAIYPMGMQHWFPKYQSHVYHMILWNEAKLTAHPYDTILKLLEGSYMDLPNKGGTSRKIDNPLIIMTSNMTLDQMIHQKFHYNKSYIEMAKQNLSVRVQNVIVPPGHNLFLLQKLLVPILF